MYLLQIAEMGCGRCVDKISKAIAAADADASVVIELATGQAGVESTLAPATLCRLLDELGYPSQLVS